MAQIELLPEDYKNYDLGFKVTLIGDSRTGKSCLSAKATKNKFHNDYHATVGFEFYVFNVKIEEKIINLQIWDTCGQEIYRDITSSYFKNSSLAFIVYTIDDKNSFSHIDDWIKQFKAFTSPNTKIFLVGNKCDLENSRQISKEEGLKFKNDKKLDMFFEASAKRGEIMSKIFL